MPTKLITKNSSTASAVPTAGQLDQGELAVNVTDKRLFTKDSGGTVRELGTNPTSITTGAVSGTTGQFSTSLNVDGTVTADGLTVDGDVRIGDTAVGVDDNEPYSITSGGALTIQANDGTTSDTSYWGFDLLSGASTWQSGITLASNSTNAAQQFINFKTANTERMRIDSSGNLLVGTTSTGLYNTSTETGVQIDGTNANISIARSGGRPLDLNRLTSDGEIARFSKDGTNVGSIGSSNSDLMLGNSDVGLKFHDVNNKIYPWNVSTDAISDGLITLGDPAGRFKDLYLSGGVYLGGTGVANNLNDYETGTWTPTVTFDVGGSGFAATSVIAKYVKVGDLVTVTFIIEGMSGVTVSDYFARLSGLPFTPIGYEQKIRVKLHNTGVNDFWITVAGGGGLMYASSGLNDFARGDDLNGNTISGSYTYQVS